MHFALEDLLSVRYRYKFGADCFQLEKFFFGCRLHVLDCKINEVENGFLFVNLCLIAGKILLVEKSYERPHVQARRLFHQR